MLTRWLAAGLFLLLLQQSAPAQTPAVPGLSPPPTQLAPVPQPPQLVPLHQPAYGYALWVRQPLQHPHLLQPATPPPPRKFPLEATWDSGLFLESHDQQFRLHVGGNL